MSRGWFLKSCRDYSTKFNGRLRTVRVNFVRTHHVRRIKAYDQQPQILLSRVLCPSVRGNQRKRFFYRVGLASQGGRSCSAVSISFVLYLSLQRSRFF
jgi:hypothetical protein